VTYNRLMSSGGNLLRGSRVTSSPPSRCILCSSMSRCSMYTSRESLLTTCTHQTTTTNTTTTTTTTTNTKALSCFQLVHGVELRSILTVLLATILAISHVSINPTPSTCQSLFIIFAPRRCRWLATAVSKGGGGGTPSQKGRTKPLNCSNLTVTDVRC